jgi:hypothetical protein
MKTKLYDNLPSTSIINESRHNSRLLSSYKLLASHHCSHLNALALALPLLAFSPKHGFQ